jgi:N-methylhydantoinase B
MSAAHEDEGGLSPLLLSVLANRFDAVVREMSNTLLRAARSAVINSARDFSCGITTADDEMFSSAEGLPVHIFGLHLQTRSMRELHPDLAEGDAYLHNDPYLGNTHPADHTILVPVFWEGQHVFNVCAKAHQADIGNSLPTTYHATARDVYEEGALIFPCVRVERGRRTNEDVIRMCRRRIRVPDQWHGDFLAALGAARTGERRLHEVFAKYGAETIARFKREWLAYSERRMRHVIRGLPAARLEHEAAHDPMPPILPDGVPLRVKIDVDPDAEEIRVDLRDNIDCMPNGLNLSEACAVNNAVTGIFNCLPSDVPRNAGSFRRIHVLLRENSAIGIPRFPHSCSVATTNVADRLVNVVQSGNNGGPGGPAADGWLTYALPVVAGLMYRDSVEIVEQKYPVHVRSVRVTSGRGGAGRRRGAPPLEVVYGPRFDPMAVVFASDGQRHPPRGALGGHDGNRGETWKIERDGGETRLGNVGQVIVEPGELLRSVDTGGGGYGPPEDREPERVLDDVREGWETQQRAETIYGVVLAETADGALAIDAVATARRRRSS